MKIRTKSLIVASTAILLVTAFAFIYNKSKNATPESNTQATTINLNNNSGTQPQNDTAPDLRNATPAEVASYALSYVQSSGDLRSGTPQVLLSRTVKAAEMPALGLGCFSFASIEEPPFVLVILKGDIHPRVPGATAVMQPAGTNYVAYVFDLWAGSPTLIAASADGSRYRKVLNDPSLPAPANGDNIPVCPTDPPKTLHYGDYVPTADISHIPTYTPAPPAPTLVPAPIGTEAAPL